MTPLEDKQEGHNTRGAVVRLFGVMLIILGSLNTMLSWRGGFELLSLPVVLIAGGLLLCLIGSIMREYLN
ncbi:MAG: hypothetical protein GY945_13800 [Rhodobacteraceae bacterium]|nr:hypothetical protein [Paracoccaceae bacterium]